MRRQYLTFEIEHQQITRTDTFHVVGGSKNYLWARFSCCEDWQGETPVAIFTAGGKSYRQLLDSGECKVPWEVLRWKRFYVSAIAGERITSNAAVVEVDPSGYTGDPSDSTDPTPTVYEQWVRLVTAERTAAEAAADRAEAAQFHGPIIGENSTWLVWDADAGVYTDTGVFASGGDAEMELFPKIVNVTPLDSPDEDNPDYIGISDTSSEVIMERIRKGLPTFLDVEGVYVSPDSLLSMSNGRPVFSITASDMFMIFSVDGTNIHRELIPSSTYFFGGENEGLYLRDDGTWQNPLEGVHTLFLVTISGSGTTDDPYVADRTYDEISSALSAGFLPVVDYPGLPASVHGPQRQRCIYDGSMSLPASAYHTFKSSAEELSYTVIIFSGGRVRASTEPFRAMPSATGATVGQVLTVTDSTREDGYAWRAPPQQLPTPTAEDAGKTPVVNADGTGYELEMPAAGGGEREWSLLGEIDISAVGGGDIELTGLDNFTEFYCAWDTVKNESTTASRYGLYINGTQISNTVLPIRNMNLTTPDYGWSKIDFNGLIWQVQMSNGATYNDNMSLNNSNALFPYNHVLDVGKAVTFKLSAPLTQYQAVSGVIKIYGR